jgi:hypothetical protein
MENDNFSPGKAVRRVNNIETEIYYIERQFFRILKADVRRDWSFG